ncbi:CST complex subunit CTC1 isoform X2 [Solanum verrucosum]|uniref:CST complex subunit CTC1 isoform X2 n=1 Tax=Solanum verrucosum TaxID=315347 RepID=UPI0020D17206|nr:CST complex subunit CTC1 isoform X2 [Solanum verrucosum]
MVEGSVKSLTIAELLRECRPRTGASSLISSPCPKIPPPHFSPSLPTPTPTLSSPKILKSLNHPTLLTGILFLPPHGDGHDSPLNCNCFRFSDGADTVCCDILRFNPSMINKKVQILGWNFIPFNCNANANGGFLEIIRWAFLDSTSASSDTFSILSRSCVDQYYSVKARYFVCGLVESVSPVSVVPCRAGSTAHTENLHGFLVNILVCSCKLCNSKYNIRLDMRYSNDHFYNKPEIVYFCGSASSWHPVLSRLIKRNVSISGLKKRLVFVGKKLSRLMYVVVDNSLMYIPNFPLPLGVTDVRGEGELVSYTGTVTGIYMRGMIVELDNELLLLLTDQQLSVPHSVRVGAMVSVKNVHVVNPNFSWTKTLILGSCVKTSISVECFSSLETGCYTVTCCENLLAKFIDSLAFVARLWVLLVIICLRRKFSGILSEKEILGSTNRKGLAQTYATSYLPPSVFRIRHGMFMEFVKHDKCACGRERSSAPLKLVAPIANLINSCEAMWKKMICHQDTDFNIMGTQKENNSISCDGRPYVLSIRKAIHSEDIGVSLLGILKVSQSSGRMLLVDATGSIDVIIPDLPLSLNINNIYEVRNFFAIMEDIPMKLGPVDLLQNAPFTCRSIFENAPLVREMNMPLHFYYDLRDLIPVNHHFTTSVHSPVDFQKVGRGKYHLLQLMHKFPILQKHQFQGSQHASNTSSTFAEALILPWDLLIAGNNRDTCIEEPLIDQLKQPMKFFNRMEIGKLIACKRQKPDQLSNEALTSALNDTGNEPSYSSSHPAYTCSFVVGKRHDSCCPEEIPCLVMGNCVNYPFLGMLHHTDTRTDVGSCSKPQVRRALLEFKSEALSVYERLKIGSHYLIKHQKEDMFCTDAIGDTIVVNSGTNIWSVSFSSVNVHQNFDVSCLLQQSGSFLSHNNDLPEGYHQFQIPNSLPNGSNDISSDVNLYMPSDVTNLFDVNLVLLENCSLEPLVPFGEMTNICPSDHNLPEGNLTSIHGQIKAVHYSDGKSYAAHLRCESINGVCPSLFLEGTISICVHVLIDHKMVKIFGSANKPAYPAGFGRGVTASFHRVLALSAQDNFMLIPTSFIVINPSSLINDHSVDPHTYKSAALDLDGGSPFYANTASLIADTVSCLATQQVEFHCRVVAIYVLVLEYNTKNKYHLSRTESRPNSFAIDIPLAGFILDHGSSSCCCWASWERAAVFLGLHDEELRGEAYAETCKKSRKTRKKQACSSLRSIMKRHGTVTVRNQASTFDSSCQDLVFSAQSKKIISSLDRDFFQSLILKACCSTPLTVVGSLVNSDAIRQLETHLTELDIVMLPMQNVWVSEVGHMDSLAQAKKILQGIVES